MNINHLVRICAALSVLCAVGVVVMANLPIPTYAATKTTKTAKSINAHPPRIQHLRFEDSVGWQLCAPCVPGGYVNIFGQHEISLRYRYQSPHCIWLTGTIGGRNIYAVFPDGSTGTVTGTQSFHYDYCHSRKFRIRVYLNIVDEDGRVYHYREVRAGQQGDSVHVGWDCDGFTCNGEDDDSH